MIVDFLHYPDGHVFESELCIIGAGAAGITIAQEFLGSGISVLLLESGGYKWEASTQELYRSEVAGLEHKGIHDGRARIFGGTTTLWAGQTLPLDDLDFECRPWVAESGWPLCRRDLEPFYRRAQRVLHLDPINDRTRQWAYSRFPAIDPARLSAQMSHFSPRPNFAATYRRQLSAAKNIQVLLHANAVRLEANSSASIVRTVAIKSLCGKQGRVRARLYVVCCGGIETPRLLLASDEVERHGLGNRHDLIGRYFQDHVQHRPARVKLTNPENLSFLRLFHRDGVAYSPRLVLSSVLQRKRRTLSACLGCVPANHLMDDGSPVEAARRVYRRIFKAYMAEGLAKDLRLTLAAPRDVAAAAVRRFWKGEPALKRQGDVSLELQTECEPNASSRITLTQDTDPLGMPRVRLDWRLTPLFTHTVRVAVETFDHELRRFGLGRIDFRSFESSSTETQVQGFFTDMYHHIGTCRMSSDPSKGVVNADCQMHTVENLFIGGSSVFPTSGYSNPTFTIIALAIRLADHIKARLASSPGWTLRQSDNSASLAPGHPQATDAPQHGEPGLPVYSLNN